MRMCQLLLVLLLVAVAGRDAVSAPTAGELSKFASPPLDQGVEMDIDGHRMLQGADETVDVVNEERGIVTGLSDWSKAIYRWLRNADFFGALKNQINKLKEYKKAMKIRRLLKKGKDEHTLRHHDFAPKTVRTALGDNREMKMSKLTLSQQRDEKIRKEFGLVKV